MGKAIRLRNSPAYSPLYLRLRERLAVAGVPAAKGLAASLVERQRDRTEGSGRGDGVLQESAARDSLLTIIGGAHGRTFRLGLGVVD